MDDKSKGYLAGIFGVILTGVFIIMSVQVDLIKTSTGQFTLLFAIIFGILSFGSFLRPESIGLIFAQFLERFGDGSESSSNEITTKQKFSDVQGTLVQTFGSNNSTTLVNPPGVIDQETIQKQKEMDLVVAPLYVNSRNDKKRIYFMKGSPANIASVFRSDTDYFEFWDKIKMNQHYCVSYLRISLENYYKFKSDTIHDEPDLYYQNAETSLIQAIERRYQELLKN
jgi:hypothetical protein